MESTPASSASGQKRTRSNSPDVTDTSHSQTDLNTTRQDAWKGWAEIENEPLIFTHLLRSWGVVNVSVDEVIPLDVVYTKPDDTVLGLVFLSRWTPPDNNDNIVQAPQTLWFANQLSTYSCATLALMNIINNQPRFDLGPSLNEFKEKTMMLSSKDRGIALDSFEFVRNVHNSFSREIDHMIVDLQLKEDVQAASKRRAPQKKKKRKVKTRKKRQSDDDENGFHFIAYLPYEGQVWKLDGMEADPRSLGSCNSPRDWLDASIDDIQSQMQAAEENAVEFSVMSLTYEPGAVLEEGDEARIQRIKEDWSPFIVQLLKLHAERGDIEDILE